MEAMMDRVGIVCGLEGISGKTISLSGQELLSLFEEEEPSLEEIRESFGVFDANNDGFIDCSELQRVVCNLGLKEGCELEDCKKMIKAFDGNGDGLIDFQDFIKLMESCLC
ncbi:probable calcium-binding protein CML45 [Sesamum indicum]|uniref:Probable calcium-binding protein CML45 n=1 Tax=Sesamum indicum TaxID=4182 RepID=A0A6I9T125_SESIN|nr:probable calcium-binding protein CML45 [Sesamum indicum]